jgi:hypothetical protein
MKKDLYTKRLSIILPVLFVLLSACLIINEFWPAAEKAQEEGILLPGLEAAIAKKATPTNAYDISLNEDGRYFSKSPSQDLDFTYANNAFRVKVGDSYHRKDIALSYALQRIMVNNSLLPVSNAPEFIHEGNTLSQKHGNVLQVDFTNTADGMRQDFVI